MNKIMNKNTKNKRTKTPMSTFTRSLLFSFFVALLFSLFFSCQCGVETNDNPRSNSDKDTDKDTNTNTNTNTINIPDPKTITRLLLENTNSNPADNIALAEIEVYATANGTGKNYATQSSNEIDSGAIFQSYFPSKLVDRNTTGKNASIYLSDGNPLTENWVEITFNPPIPAEDITNLTFKIYNRTRGTPAQNASILGTRFHLYDNNDDKIYSYTPGISAKEDPSAPLHTFVVDLLLIDTPIQIINTSPTNNAEGIAFTPSIIIGLDRRAGLNSDANFILSTNDANDDEDISFNASDTRLLWDLNNNSLSIALTNALTPDTPYTFTLPEDAFMDGTGNANDTYSFTFTTTNAGIPIDSSFFSLSTNIWYETQSTDDGSFNQTIDIAFPADGVGTNSSLSGVFGVDLEDRNGDGDIAIPITIEGLPDGLILNLTKTSTGIYLSLIGNATTHAKHVDNTSFDLTFLSDFFETSSLYSPADISFSFDIAFGSKRWSPRRGHQAFVYDNKIWVLGGNGGTGNSKKSDIWTSEDNGTNWTQISVTGPQWSPRRGHQAFAYDDKIWVLGGDDNSFIEKINDIWTSEDGGSNWTEVDVTGTQWSARREFQSFVYNNKIWVLGGYIGNHEDLPPEDYTNDIWTSEDGTNWTEVSVTAPYWSVRRAFQSFVYDNKIWVLGGRSRGSLVYKNDIWTSEDGITWAETSPNEPYWSERSRHQSFVHKDKLFVLGGHSLRTTPASKNEIWTSEDKGTNWTSVSVTGTHWSGRGNHQSLVHNDKIFVLGGDSDTEDFLNDIWISADGGVTWELIPEFY